MTKKRYIYVVLAEGWNMSEYEFQQELDNTLRDTSLVPIVLRGVRVGSDDNSLPIIKELDPVS